LKIAIVYNRESKKVINLFGVPNREKYGLASGVMLGIDCHTMAAKGPPIGPDPGKERPLVCLSNARRDLPSKLDGIPCTLL